MQRNIYYAKLGHGFGLGIGTTAEGWIDDAISFWEKHMDTNHIQDGLNFKEKPNNENWSWKTVNPSYYEPAEHRGNLEQITYTTNGASAWNGTAAATVYTPYEYRDNEKSKYNVLYLQHGGGGNETTYLGTPKNPTKFVNMVDQWIFRGFPYHMADAFTETEIFPLLYSHEWMDESTLTEQLYTLVEQSDAFALREQPNEDGNLLYHKYEKHLLLCFSV